MDELKPCRRCGRSNYFEGHTMCRCKILYSIRCRNIKCEDAAIVAYGSTKEAARERAVKKWNRRAEDA
jgi:hypothetical protein